MPTEVQPRDVYVLLLQVYWWVRLLVGLSVLMSVIMVIKMYLHWKVYRLTKESFESWFSLSKSYNVIASSILDKSKALVEDGTRHVQKIVEDAAQRTIDAVSDSMSGSGTKLPTVKE